MSRPINRVQATAPGKLNLYFEVGGLQPNGYHLVASVYQAVSLEEVVSASASDNFGLSVSGSLDAAQLAEVPTGAENLVFRAAHLLAQKAGIELPSPVHFEIFKAVPLAGGMGGGSADAAAALVALNELWCLGFSEQELLAIGTELGADVPFAMLGGAALGTGTGSSLESVSSGELHLVLLPAGVGLSTPRVYAQLDSLRSAAGESVTDRAEPEAPLALLTALAAGDASKLAKHMRNDLEPAALSLLPELSQRIELATNLGALRAMVSGSGPTVMALCESAGHAADLALALAERGEHPLVIRSSADGVRLRAE